MEPSRARASGTLLAVSGILGALGVAFGAFGAHAVPEIAPAGRVDTFNTGAAYHMYHALAMLGAAVLFGWRQSRFFLYAWWCFLAGVLLFSGSLYALVLADAPVLARITPVGGMAFIVGWALIAWGGATLRRPDPGA